MTDAVASQNPTTLDTFVRKLSQPRGGYLPVTEMHTRIGGKPRVVIDTDFSRMLLSTVVRHIAAYAVFLETDREQALLPPLERAKTSLLNMRAKHLMKRDIARAEAIVDRIYASPVSYEGIKAWCELITFAPIEVGGSRRFPDGGRICPTRHDAKIIQELAYRTAKFLQSDDSEELFFEKELEIAENVRSFASARINFLSGKGAYKISPSTKLPQPRDTLLVTAQAMLAGVDVFGIYNPAWDVFHWSRITDIPADRRIEIKKAVLGR